MRLPQLWICRPLPTHGFALPPRLIFLGRRRVLVGFDVNFNLSAFFQLHFLAVLVGQRVLNSNFLIERLGPMNIYLRFLRFARVYRLNQFFHGARFRCLGSRHLSAPPSWLCGLEGPERMWE